MGQEDTDNQIQTPLLQTHAAERPLKRTGLLSLFSLSFSYFVLFSMLVIRNSFERIKDQGP